MANYRKNTDSDQLAGELCRRVAFLKREVTVKSGISTERWALAFSCWAKMEPLSGREYWSAAALNRENELRVTVRFRRDVDPAFRVQVMDTVYDIKSIVNPGMRFVKLEILAASVVPDGKVSP